MKTIRVYQDLGMDSLGPKPLQDPADPFYKGPNKFLV